MRAAGPALVLRSASLDDTRAIAAAVAELCRPRDLVVLAGEMGSGKTAFAQGFGAALGVTEPVTSPTFTLVHSYAAGGIELHHADVYRLDWTSEVADLAFGELLEAKGIVLVEWGDVIAAQLGDHLEVRLEWVDPAQVDVRRITIRPKGPGWATRWARLDAALTGWRDEEAPC